MDFYIIFQNYWWQMLMKYAEVQSYVVCMFQKKNNSRSFKTHTIHFNYPRHLLYNNQWTRPTESLSDTHMCNSGHSLLMFLVWCFVQLSPCFSDLRSEKRFSGSFTRPVSPPHRLVVVVVVVLDSKLCVTGSLCLSATMRLAALRTKIFGS